MAPKSIGGLDETPVGKAVGAKGFGFSTQPLSHVQPQPNLAILDRFHGFRMRSKQNPSSIEALASELYILLSYHHHLYLYRCRSQQQANFPRPSSCEAETPTVKSGYHVSLLSVRVCDTRGGYLDGNFKDGQECHVGLTAV